MNSITQIIRDEIANHLIQQPNKIYQTKPANYEGVNYDTYTYITEKLGHQLTDIRSLGLPEIAAYDSATNGANRLTKPARKAHNYLS